MLKITGQTKKIRIQTKPRNMGPGGQLTVTKKESVFLISFSVGKNRQKLHKLNTNKVVMISNNFLTND